MKFEQIISDFHVQDRTEMEERIDAAVGAACKHAMDSRLGVLVTRHDFGHFSVSVTPRVPFGFTREHDYACRS